MSEEKSKSKLEDLINGADWAAILVVLVATLALIFVVFNAIKKEAENTAPKEIIVKYEFVVDTIALMKVKDPAIIKTVADIDENNKKILAEINTSVDAQYKRMESILAVQEDRSKMFSYGAGFLAILVALATFFGFKSINEMKKGTIEVAEYEAKKIAEEKAKEVAQKIAEEKTKEELANKLDGITTQLESSLTSDFQQKLDLRELTISDDFRNSIRNEFDTKLNELRQEFYNPNQNTDSNTIVQSTTENTGIEANAFEEKINISVEGEDLFDNNDLNN